MTSSRSTDVTVLALALIAGLGVTVLSETVGTERTPAAPACTFLIDDAISEAHTPRKVEGRRPEEHTTVQDSSGMSSEDTGSPVSTELNSQADKGRTEGFVFTRNRP